jgi:hypothetical protein
MNLHSQRSVALALVVTLSTGCERAPGSSITETSTNRTAMDGFAARAARTGVPDAHVPMLRAMATSAVAQAMGPDSIEVRRGLMVADPTSIYIVPAKGDTALERVVSQWADAVDREYPGYKLAYLRNLADSRGLKGDLEFRAAPQRPIDKPR